MAIGFAGSSRTGKTTLARQTAKLAKIPFIDLSFTRIAKDLGVDPVRPMSIEERMDMQEQALARYDAILENQSDWFITDRTPLDMVAYAMAEIGMHSDPVMGERVAGYMVDCIRTTRLHFNTVIITRPLPFYEAAVGKPPLNLGYQAHTQLIIEGALAMVQGRGMATMTLYTVDAGERIETTMEFINKRMQVIVDERGGVVH